MTTIDVTLTPTERELVLRLAHGARIHWTLGGQSITIPARVRPFVGCQLPVGEGLWCKLAIAHTEPCDGVPADQLPASQDEQAPAVSVPRDLFDRLRELGFFDADEQGPLGTWYVLSTPGRVWATANIGMGEMPTATPTRERRARPIVRQPLCTQTPVPFEDDPAVCDNCGNLIDAHPVDPQVQRRITEAMWRVVIALGGPHNTWSGGDDEQTSLHFREHMATCGIDWAATTDRPQMQDAGLTHDTENSTTVQLMGGWLKCLCGRVNDQITVRDLTLGQLMWQVAHIDDAPPLALT